ncbi:MAG: SNF2 helicase associated domain-containing protein [Verrucomicrobia bacterium]|nr:SNF2 helicase associated domain-containing protein [Verrucomicrobiota bacterium]
MLITEKILSDTSGWQVMKAARALLAANAVEQTERAGDVFRGLVREGKRKYATTLTMQGPTKADCRCSCSEAQRGLVCAHAIVVALATLQPATTPATTRPSEPVKIAAPALSKQVPVGRFDIFIPAQRIESLSEGRGQLPVFLQFQTGGDETDLVAQWLTQQGLPVQSGPLSLDAATLGGFLNALRDHLRVWEGRPGTAVEQRRKITVAADSTELLQMHVSLVLPNEVKFISQSRSGGMIPPTIHDGGWKPPLLIAERWLFNQESLTLAPLPEGDGTVSKLIQDCLDKKNGGGAVRDLRWLARNLDALENVLSLETDEALSHLRLVPAEPRFVIELDGSPRQATARVEVVVGTVRHPLASPNQEPSGEPYPIPAGDGTLTFYQRHPARETRLRSELETAGFSATPEGGWFLKGEREVAKFFAVALPTFQRRHEVVFSERWQAAFRGWKRIAPMVRRRDGVPSVTPEPPRGWLDMEFAYEAADGFRVPRQEVLRLIRSGQRTVRGNQGQTYALDSDSCDEFESLLSESGARLGEEEHVALSADNGHVLNEFLAVGQPVSKLVLPDATEVRRRLGDLAGKLRDYQLEGVRWLIASAEAGRGALLADDMGLGKTVQVIALLRWLATCEQPPNREQHAPRSALVVCPTSLISNWSDEIERFASKLHVNIMHGSDRVIHKLITNKFNVILTSYALMSRDLDKHNKSYYQAVILDEASHIRNPDTAAAKAVCSLNSPVRVALTGTPVENSVQDLWSLMRG